MHSIIAVIDAKSGICEHISNPSLACCVQFHDPLRNAWIHLFSQIYGLNNGAVFSLQARVATSRRERKCFYKSNQSIQKLLQKSYDHKLPDTSIVGLYLRQFRLKLLVQCFFLQFIGIKSLNPVGAEAFFQVGSFSSRRRMYTQE